MIKLLRRFWKYVTAGANQKFNEKADPKIQLEQALVEAQDQHRRLKEHAANVIAQQKQTELQLNRAMTQLEKLNSNARQAVMMADQATKSGDTAKAEQYTKAAETIATQLITTEKQIEDLKQTHYAATQASDQAKAAVAANGQMLQQKLAERNKLLGQLEQARMQEQMNKAMTSLSETVGEDVPTLNEVRDKIEARYAKAQGMSELAGNSVESSMLEIEQAAANSDAQARLSEIRAQLGIAPAEAAGVGTGAPEVGAGTPTAEPVSQPETEPAQVQQPESGA
ncbi:MAG: Phage shock protein suppresses sigma54-dependent transcription [Acidimicrobiales bacterium]|nr:Phage shock protein suppresses sigma54-dependent transcription [Acidimicrobiales bacterium]